MMTELQKQIFDYVKKNQPATVSEIVRDVGIYRSMYYRETSELRELGFLQSMPGVGVFAGADGVQQWLENGGREKLSEWGRRITSNVQMRHRGGSRSSDDSPQMFQPYNRARNSVVAEYMLSAARQRLMMVYGRAGE